MRLRYSSLKAALLGAMLLLLSAKGGQELVIDDSFSLIVELPAWLIALKAFVVPIAAALMAAFVVLAVMARKKFVHAPLLNGYVVVLVYYFLRSAWLGSGIQSNLLALAILLAFALAISLEFGTNRSRGTMESGWITPLSHFSRAYVVLTFALLVMGYGYPQVGSRFIGMTYHANAEGAFAALCAGFFLVMVVRCGLGTRQYFVEGLFFALALVLVVASGSRTATLMALVAFVCLVRVRYAIVASIAAFAAAYLAPGMGTSEGEATISGAITRMLEATTGNRQEVWSQLLSDFYAHPLLGVGDTTNVSGSGFLTAFAGDGIVGGLLFLAVFLAATKQSFKLILKFRLGGGWNPRLVAAVLMLQMLIGAIFEGALFDKFSPFPLLAMVLLTALWIRSPQRKVATEAQRL